jgi:hypothetical protein
LVTSINDIAFDEIETVINSINDNISAGLLVLIHGTENGRRPMPISIRPN